MSLPPRARQTVVLCLGYDAKLRMWGVLCEWWASTDRRQTESRQAELDPLTVDELNGWVLDYLAEFVEEGLRAADHFAPDALTQELRRQMEQHRPPDEGGRHKPGEATG